MNGFHLSELFRKVKKKIEEHKQHINRSDVMIMKQKHKFWIKCFNKCLKNVESAANFLFANNCNILSIYLPS